MPTATISPRMETHASTFDERVPPVFRLEKKIITDACLLANEADRFRFAGDAAHLHETSFALLHRCEMQLNIQLSLPPVFFFAGYSSMIVIAYLEIRFFVFLVVALLLLSVSFCSKVDKYFTRSPPSLPSAFLFALF